MTRRSGGSVFSAARSIRFTSVISMPPTPRSAALALDEIVFMPAHDPPQRPVEPRASRLSSVRAGRAGGRGSPRMPRVGHGAGARRAVVHRSTRCARCTRGAGGRRSFSSSSAPMRLQKLPRGTSIRPSSTLRISSSSRGPASTIDEATARDAGAARRRARCPRGDDRLATVHADFPRRSADARRVVDDDSRAARERTADRRSRPAAVARHIREHHLYGAVDELHGEDERI